MNPTPTPSVPPPADTPAPSVEAMAAILEIEASVNLFADEFVIRRLAETVDRHFAPLRDSLMIYRDEQRRAVEACAWMHDDESLNLCLGSRLTVDGVTALKGQRDTLRADVARLNGELAQACQQRDLNLDLFKTNYEAAQRFFQEITALRKQLADVTKERDDIGTELNDI